MKDSKPAIMKYVLAGFVITAVMVGITFLIEHTYWGHRLELFAIELLQRQESRFDPDEQLPIVVVDISNVREGKDGQLIDLDRLKEILSAIVEQKPRAIAVDAVLIPETEELQKQDVAKETAKQTQQYFEFLDFCLQLKETGTPIFLAVGERTIEKPENWLGAEKYKDMAATVLIKEDTTRIPIWLKASPDSEKLFSLSVSLANSVKKVHLPTGLSWAIETEEQLPGTRRHLEENIEYAEALVNFSKLEAIQENKLLTLSKVSIKESSEKFRNRIVILGDGTKERAMDNRKVAGRTEVIPGVYIHACAAYTFAREPMYEFKLPVRLSLDLFLSAFVICWVAINRRQHLNERKVFDWHKLQNRLTIITALVVLFAAVCLVWWTGVVWPDFLLVAGALWLHPKVEKRTSPKQRKRR